jgi:predicted nucleic acid-binding protein
MTLTIDTNVLVYSVDEREPGKQRIARELLWQLERRDAVVALQVVGEFQSAVRRRLKRTARDAAAMAAGVLFVNVGERTNVTGSARSAS